MFGFRKSPANNEPDKKQDQKPARRTSSEPSLVTPNSSSNPFDDDDDDYFGKGSSNSLSAARNKKKNPSAQDFDSMSVQELEGYAVDKAEETTNTVNNCLKIAEDIRQDASKTLETLHQQGEQIHRTHLMATDIDHDLSKGEKILGNLGGMFSFGWKPKKGKEIKGPTITPGSPPHSPKQDNNAGGKAASKEQREKLGVAPAPKGGRGSRTPPSEPMNAMQKVELEKEKQDDALSDLSNILGDLKGMAVDMGSELDKQNKALDHLSNDVDELNSRMKGANQRARHLLGK